MRRNLALLFLPAFTSMRRALLFCSALVAWIALPVLAQFTANDTIYFGVNLPSVSGVPYTFAGTPAVADFNKDGHSDAVVQVTARSSGTNGFASIANGFVVLLGNGYGAFRPLPVILPPITPCSASGTVCSGIQISTADINGDRNPDVLFSLVAQTGTFPHYVDTPLAFLYLGNGDGTFQEPIDISKYIGGLGPIVAVDLQHNGKVDLVSQSIPGPVQVALGNGDGTFQNPTLLPCVTDRGCLGSFAVGDLGNGQIDIVVATLDTDQQSGFYGGIEVLLGNGDGTFKVGPTYPDIDEADPFVGIIDFYQMVLGNFGPGHKTGLSILVENDQTAFNDYSIFVMDGNGDGSFGEPITPALDVSGFDYLSGEAVGDINGDGVDDLVFGAINSSIDFTNEGPGFVTWLLSTGKGRFIAPHPLVMGTLSVPACAGIRKFTPALSLADLTGSGRLDAIGVFPNTDCMVVFHNADTTTTLTSSANPDIFSNGITLQATVSGSMTVHGSGFLTPPGGMSFYDNGKLLGSRALSAGHAIYSNLVLPIGTHQLTAAYTGDFSYLASTSAPLQQIVNGIPTAISLITSANPVNHNNSVTFTATITAPGTSAGKLPNSASGIGVYFYNNGVLFAERAVDVSGTATVTTKFRPGTHQITVKYLGNSYFAPSTSNLITEEVN